MPRRWRTLAEQKTPPFVVRTAGGREVLEGTSKFTFLVTSFLNEKEVTPQSYPRSAKQYARPKENSKNPGQNKIISSRHPPLTNPPSLVIIKPINPKERMPSL
jgi:hypothetical protein